MEDMVLKSFLDRQWEEAQGLDAASDIISLRPLEDESPQHYLVHFKCKGLVKRGDTPEVVEGFTVGIWFSDDYLRIVEPASVLTWLAPAEIWNPHVRLPYVCMGHINPGTPLVDLCYRLWAVIVGENCAPREDDALNREACAWWRRHMDDFPLDDRPLKRRKLDVRIEDVSRKAER